MAKKKLNIAFLSFYSGHVNRGGEVFVYELAQRLGNKHDVVVYQSGPATKDKRNYKISTIPTAINWDQKDISGSFLHAIFLDYWGLKILRFTLNCLPLLLKKNFDVVVPIDGGWMPAFVRLVTWTRGGKMLISGQSGQGWDDFVNLWSFPDIFVATSKKAKEWAESRNPFVKRTHIPNGVDLKKFSPKGKRYKHGLSGKVVLCVGALTKQKRTKLVIKAVQQLENVSLLVVGDGPLKEEVNELGRKFLMERYKQVSVEHNQMPSVYRSADIFALTPEPSEAFGIVFVEAMASGLPVVTIDDSVRKNIVGDAGVFVDPMDSTRFSHVLKSALTKKWGKKPQNQARKFNWERIADKYDKIIESLV